MTNFRKRNLKKRQMNEAKAAAAASAVAKNVPQNPVVETIKSVPPTETVFQVNPKLSGDCFMDSNNNDIYLNCPDMMNERFEYRENVKHVILIQCFFIFL